MGDNDNNVITTGACQIEDSFLWVFVICLVRVKCMNNWAL